MQYNNEIMYSIDYRKRAVEYKREGHTFKQLWEAFRIPSETYYRWSKEYEDGFTKPTTPRTRTRKIDREALRQAVEEKPDAYLRELAKPFGCTPTAIHQMLETMGITLKKRRSPMRKNAKNNEQPT